MSKVYCAVAFILMLFPFSPCGCSYAGIFWHPLGHVLCLHQWLVADQRASAAGLHRRRPPVRQEAPGDGLRPQHPGQPRPHRPPPSCRPRERGDMPPAAQVRRWPAGDGLPREHGVAFVRPCGYHTVPGVQRVKDRYLVRMNWKRLALPIHSFIEFAFFPTPHVCFSVSFSCSVSQCQRWLQAYAYTKYINTVPMLVTLLPS